jgi:Na+/proline symporter
VIAMLTINGLVGIMAQPHQIAAVGTGKDERTCRIGMFYGNFVKRVCTVGWALVGLIVAAMVAQGQAPLADAEDAFGFACRRLLFPGALGLMIASILAANMSTCSAFLVDSGALFTEGLYRRRLMPGKPDRHYLRIGRVSGFVITILGVLYALFLIQSVLYTFLLTETMATFVGISVLGGILWQRANRWGALASMVCALTVNFLLYFVTGQRLDHWDANVFLAALLAGTAALIVVSLLTQPEPAARIESFFERLETCSDGGEGPTQTGGHGSTQTNRAGQPLLLVNLLHLRRVVADRGWRVFREDLGGFAVAWILVIALVAATAMLLS